MPCCAVESISVHAAPDRVSTVLLCVVPLGVDSSNDTGVGTVMRFLYGSNTYAAPVIPPCIPTGSREGRARNVTSAVLFAGTTSNDPLSGGDDSRTRTVR